MSSPTTRFAPSPTGFLHLGHVVNAIYVWGVAQAGGGRVLLRVEDHDRIRSRPAYDTALLEDLDWLGFVPDDGRHPVVRQSDRDEVYAAALEPLRARGLVYACACSRTHIGGGPYPGTCRDRGLAEQPGRGLRVRLPRGRVTATDLRLGVLEQDPAAEYGDVLVKDRDGQWTYQFAVTVDDLRQRISLVVRGLDLVSSTGRQVQLARLLGRPAPPIFLHHPVITHPDGRKLSKAAGDSGIRDLRARGHTAAEVIGMAAAAVDLVPPGTHLAASDAGTLIAVQSWFTAGP